MFVRAEKDSKLEKVVEHVDFDLHPTFDPPTIRVSKPPYSISRLGWGTFEVRIRITWKCELGLSPSIFTHLLRFSHPETSKIVSLYQDKDKDLDIEESTEQSKEQ